MIVNFVMLQLKLGGGNKVFSELAGRIGRKTKVRIITGATVHPNMVKFSNAEVVRVGYASTGAVSRLMTLIKLMLYVVRLPYNQIFVYSDPFLALPMGLIPKKRKIRFIQADDYHIFDHSSKLPFLLKSVFKALILISFNLPGHEFIFNSEFAFQRTKSKKISALPRVILAPGVDTEKYYPERSIKEAAISVLARKEAIKGFRIFEEAIALLGSSQDFEYNKIILFSQDAEIKTEISNYVYVQCRNEDENRRVLNTSEVFVFPSLREGFGLPPLEAMACGCVCIISECGGISEYAKNNVNCLTFKSGNIDDLAKKLLMVSRIDKDKMIQEGFLTVRRFTWDKIANDFYRILYKIDDEGVVNV